MSHWLKRDFFRVLECCNFMPIIFILFIEFPTMFPKPDLVDISFLIYLKHENLNCVRKYSGNYSGNIQEYSYVLFLISLFHVFLFNFNLLIIDILIFGLCFEKPVSTHSYSSLIKRLKNSHLIA